jgi:tRNA G18 (ribose-2'-O)-methylase SpoU
LATIVSVSEPADPRLAPYLRVRERDLVGRDAGFIAEGEVVLRALLGPRSRCRPRSLLIAENRLARLGPLIETLPDDAPVYVASQAVMDAAVGFHIHRGVLAHGERPPDPGAERLLGGLPDRARVVALFGIANHDNVGGVFRNAAAFGADAVLIDPASCDPLYRKAIRVSVGAALTMPFARLRAGEDAVALLQGAGFEVLALSPSGRERLDTVIAPARTALLLGAEGPGLPPQVMERARTVSIAMAPGWDSLNLAAASAVALHHLGRL